MVTKFPREVPSGRDIFNYAVAKFLLAKGDKIEGTNMRFYDE